VNARTFAGIVVIILALVPSCRPPDAAGETDPALSALVDSLLPAVERVSLLSASRPVRVDVRSPDQVRQFVVRKLDQELPAPELEGIRRVYARLGLIPEDLDLRGLLLATHGIGPETADSIVLYAAGQPSFVIDAYARRIFSRVGVAPAQDTYGGWQRLFMEALPADAAMFNEYHALIVAHGKGVCRKAPRCGECALRGLCDTGRRPS